jgi:hypothetical protein
MNPAVNPIHEVKVSDRWPGGLIEITTWDMASYFYYRDERGNLILGQPWAYSKDNHHITLFTPLPHGQPIILEVSHPCE